jgi:hypothetical protein
MYQTKIYMHMCWKIHKHHKIEHIRTIKHCQYVESLNALDNDQQCRIILYNKYII